MTTPLELAELLEEGPRRAGDAFIASELRRLAQVEAEHAALLKAISDAEPVAMVTTKRHKNKAHSISFGPFGGVYELPDGDYKLYTLNGIKP